MKDISILTKKEAQERVEKLRKEINYHRYLYHVLDRQEISDAALDSLKNELARLEEQFAELIAPDSPTQRVGGEARKEFAKVRHRLPMLSFNDAFSQEEFFAWTERVKKLSAAAFRNGFFLELKIDGLAVALEYEDGVFSVGSTRGDGVVGEEVTANLKTIEAIPLRLREKEEVAKELRALGFGKLADRIISRGLPRRIEARGEVFLGKREFEAINREQKRKGMAPYANPRNVAAGSVRQLDPKITASRKLDSFAYDLAVDCGQETHEETHALLRALGFKINQHNKKARSVAEASAFHDIWERNREKLPYEIDGIVVIVNDNRKFRRLGAVGKAPRGVIAFKFALKEAETVVKNIQVYVGRTGALTPVAELRPVAVGGVTITHATLHNFDQLQRIDPRVGDTVIVGRAGDVIPQILRVLPRLRPKGAGPIAPPKTCPACRTKVIKEGVFLRCPNKICPALQREGLYHFASKQAFDIAGLGPETVDKLVDTGFVRDIADFFRLTKNNLLQIEGFAALSAQKLIRAIEQRKKVPLERLIRALGILHVGEETAGLLARRFGTLTKLGRATEDELRLIPDVGPVVARSIASWFKDSRNRALLEKLEEVGVKALAQKTPRRRQMLAGKTVVFTGELSSITRDEAKTLARAHGADVSESVSKQTSFVVAGEHPGSKYDRAKKLGVAIINEKQFLHRMGKSSP